MSSTGSPNLPDLRNLRRRYLVDRAFQLRFTLYVLVFMFVVAAIAGLTVFHTGWTLLGEKLANVYPQGRLMHIFKVVNLTLLIRLLLITPVIVIMSILLSHRIAGPLVRIEKELERIGNGEFNVRITLRQGDELVHLSEVVNEMAAKLQARERNKNV